MSGTQRDDQAAWNDFWAHNARGGAKRGGAAEGGGCLPARWKAIADAQRAAWLDFVADLPNGAAALDLATGDGRVLRWMRAERSDLDLTGVDLAPQLPPAPAGTRMRAGVAMEELPFPDDNFHAVGSQFGFEYGDIEAAVGEIARVLRPSGKVGLMVHRGDGPILEHNKARREQIGWALGEKKLAGQAKQALTAGPGGAQRAHDLAAEGAREGARRFGESSPGWEIPEAIRRSVIMGNRAGIQSVVETIAAIEAQAANEIGRIDSLERACAVADDREALSAAFAGHGLTLRGESEIAEPSGRAFADFLIFA